MLPVWAAALPRVLATTIIVKQGVFTTEDLPTDTIYGLERLWSATGNGSKLTRTWFLPDGLGSPLMTTDNDGTRTSFRAFTEWGAASNPAAPLVSPFGFTGELQGDSATGGLVYLRARWYHPGDGTFLTRDPFPGFATVPYSQHPYQYGYSNPVSNTDPSGRCTSFGDDYCHETWEQLYAKYPYYAFRTEREAGWEARGETPRAAEGFIHAYEAYLADPLRYTGPGDENVDYIRWAATNFSEGYLGEYLTVDESIYYRRVTAMQLILEQCGDNVSNAFWLKYLAVAGAAYGLGYSMPMYDADDRIGGGGKGGGGGIARWQSSRIDAYKEEHVFSAQHLKDGIMELGGSREDIINMGRGYIQQADTQGWLQQGPNNIFFTANGREGTIKAYFVGNELTSFDMHAGISSRKVQNVIDFR